jgi:hypothetical protein
LSISYLISSIDAHYGVCDFRVNITVGVLEERMMLSGMHTVADIFCCCCGGIIGWKYVMSLFDTHNA